MCKKLTFLVYFIKTKGCIFDFRIDNHSKKWANNYSYNEKNKYNSVKK